MLCFDFKNTCTFNLIPSYPSDPCQSYGPHLTTPAAFNNSINPKLQTRHLRQNIFSLHRLHQMRPKRSPHRLSWLNLLQNWILDWKWQLRQRNSAGGSFLLQWMSSIFVKSSPSCTSNCNASNISSLFCYTDIGCRALDVNKV